MQRILVNRADITRAEPDTTPELLDLPHDCVRLRIESFALTVNNVTYAATGDVLKYWAFYPSGRPDRGIVPVWGTARVTESTCDGLELGARLYGYLPMAREALLTLAPVAPGVWRDTSPHRQGLAEVYNTYTQVREADAQEDHLRALLQPLLATSWLLFDWLRDNDWFGAGQIIVGSASSKTGLGLCHYLSEQDGRPYRVVGLTGTENRDFVTGLGSCDTVLGYDEIDRLAQVPSVYVDMAGSAAVKAAVHGWLGDHLRHSAAVGTSHWQDFAPPPPDLPGPKPQFFFAPAQIAKRRADWGPGVVEREITAAWKRVAAGSGAWLSVTVHDGLAAVPALWSDLAAGRARPSEGHVVRP